MQVFDNRIEMIINRVPKNGVYAEVGVFKGSLSDELYKRLTPSKLVLIDLFEGYNPSGDQDGNNFTYADMPTEHDLMKKRYSTDPNVQILKGDSSTLLSQFPDNTFDMIYIDGDHTYEGVKKDIQVAFHKVKPNGWIMGHDYEMNMAKARTHYSFGVRQAVDEFCTSHGQTILVKGLDGCVSFGIQLKKVTGSRNLVYYTVGHNPKFIDILNLSIRTLQIRNPNTDVCVLCDENMVETCNLILPKHVHCFSYPNASTPQVASMRKLCIFNNIDPSIYDKVLFIDCDTVVDADLDSIFSRIVSPDVLYVQTESLDQASHQEIYWSLKNYEDSTLSYFRDNSILPFNAGCFGFMNSDIMKHHFNEVLVMIKNYSGEYFYEQSFMNVYFNTRNITNRDVLNTDVYRLFPVKNTEYSGKIVHFTGCPGDSDIKLLVMQEYVSAYITMK
jgi:hypothetical protein